jgi:hypothetical protein
MTYATSIGSLAAAADAEIASLEGELGAAPATAVICTAWGNQILSYWFDPSITLYVALFTAEPGLGGSIANEVTGGSYARQASTFSTPSSKISSNNSILSFPNMPESYLTHIGIATTLTGTTLLTYALLPGEPIHVANTYEYRLQIGDYAVNF